MAVLKNRAGVSTATTGTGTITLGSAIGGGVAINTVGWQTFGSAGAVSGNSVRYLILDSNGTWEYGPGTYSTSGGTTLTRAPGAMDGTVAGQKSSGGTLLSLTGTAQVFITAVAEDILTPTDAAALYATPASVTAAITAATEFTTGDAKITLKTTADTGWVMMNDGTIGNVTSGASFANATAQSLFTLLYANINDANAPLFSSTGSATTRAAQSNALAAWGANCRMSLTKQLGRSLAVAGAGSGLTSRTLGGTAGAETETQTVAKMAPHTHTTGGLENVSPAHFTIPLTGGVDIVRGGISASTGGGAPLDILDPSAYWNVMIKL